MKPYLCLWVLAFAAIAAEPVSHFQAAPAQTPVGKPVARVNGVVLTDRDLLQEMYSIFPYARVHNGFPKAMEADIRKGAMQMILFEELVYQQAERQKMTIPQARLDQALIDFRKQFPNQDAYDSFMKTEVGNSKQILLMRVRRSLLIDKMLKLNVTDKAAVSDVELRTYYDHNPERFRISDSLSLQTISLLPPPNATPEQLKALKTRAGDALAQAKKTTDYNGFGLLAEKISEDDYHVMMGDHQIVDKTKLPAEILKAAGSMKDGQVSDLISVGEAYCIVRLNAHVPAGMQKFDAVRVNLRKQLQQTKVEQLRSVLGKRLRAGAKVEEL